MGYQISPLQIKIKYTKLLKVAFILLLIGFSISLIPNLAIALFIGGLYMGSYIFYYLFYFIGVFGGTVLTGIGSLLGLAGYIIIIIALVKLGGISNNPGFRKKGKITMVLFIITLSLNFLVNSITLFSGGMYSFLYSFMYSFYGYGLGGFNGYISLLVTGLFISTFIMLGLSMKELKRESQGNGKGLISAYIYPIVIIPQIIQLIDFSFYSFIVVIVIMAVGGIMEFIILIVLASEGLVTSSKILRSIRNQGTPVQFRTEPSLSPQKTLPATGKGGRFCIKCGNPILKDARFCGVCGHNIE